MTVILSQVSFWINKESVPARTVFGNFSLFLGYFFHITFLVVTHGKNPLIFLRKYYRLMYQTTLNKELFKFSFLTGYYNMLLLGEIGATGHF